MSSADCPPGFACETSIERCVRSDVEDTAAPDFDGVPVLAPLLGNATTSFELAFSVDEPLFAPPVVTLGRSGDGPAFDLVENVEGSLDYHFAYHPAAGDPEGTFDVSVELVDRYGNRGVRLLAAQLTLDDTPPITSLSWTLSGTKTRFHPGEVASFTGVVEPGVTLLGGAVIDQDQTTLSPLEPTDVVISDTTVTGSIDLSSVELATTQIAVQLSVRDAAGNVGRPEQSRSDYVEVDAVGPGSPSVQVLGSEVTTTRDVQVAISAVGATEACLYGDIGASASTCTYEPLVSPRSVTLNDGDGLKTVYARFRDEAWNETVEVSTTVRLSTGLPESRPALVIPAGQTAVKEGDLVALGGTAEPGATIVAAGLHESSTGTMVQDILPFVSLSVAGTFSGSFNWGAMAHGANVYAEVIVSLGGLQSATIDSRSATVLVDNQPPSGTSAVVRQGVVVGTPAVDLDLTAIGADEIFIQGDVEDTDETFAWIPFVFTSPLTLTAAPGLKNVAVLFRDGARHEVQKTATTVLDPNVPVSSPLLVSPWLEPRVKYGDQIAVAGSATAGSSIDAWRLVFLDGAGVEITSGCVGDAFDALTLAGDGSFGGWVNLGSGCIGAAEVALEVIVRGAAGTLSVAASSSSPSLPLDNDGPSPATAELLGVGDALPGYSATTDISLLLQALDLGTVQAKITGSIQPLNAGGWFDLPDTSGSPFSQSLVLQAGDGAKSINVSFRDAIDNVVGPLTVSLQLDSVDPPPIDGSKVRLLEASPAPWDPATVDDIDNVLTLSATGPAITNANRVRLYSDPDRTQRLTVHVAGVPTEAVAVASGVFPDVVVPVLAAPVYYMTAQDESGRESPVLTVTVPAFTNILVDAHPINARVSGVDPPVTVTFSSAACLPAPPAVKVAVQGGGYRVAAYQSCVGGAYVFRFFPNGSEVDGIDAGVLRIEGEDAAAGLAAGSVGTDARLVTFDFEAPLIVPGALSLTQAWPPGPDDIAGESGAIADLTGPDDGLRSFGVTVRVFGDGSLVATRAADALSGAFAPVSLGDNSYATIRVEATDAAGNSSAQVLNNDVLAPTLVQSGVAPSQARTGTVAALTYQLADDQHDLDAPPYVAVDGRAAQFVSGTLTTSDGVPHEFVASLLVADLDAEGTLPVTVQAVDATGNAAVLAFPSTLLVDHAPPLTANTRPAGAITWNGVPAIEGTAGDNLTGVDSVQVSVRRAGGLWWDGLAFASGSPMWLTAAGTTTWTYAGFAGSLTDSASYTIEWRAADGVGNVSNPGSASFVADVTAPETTLTVTPPPSSGEVSISFAFTCADGGPACTFECDIDGGGAYDCTDTSTTGSSSFDLGPGLHTFTVRATDAAGNVDPTPASYAFETLRNWEVVAAGNHHGCGIAQLGRMYCWGLNDVGQLGDQTTLESSAPVEVGAGHVWVSVAVDNNISFFPAHACAIEDSGALWCWGENTGGQLGSNNTQDYDAPRRVGFDNDWLQVATGGESTCAVKTNGELYCWGVNFDGQLGAPSPILALLPVRVGTHSDWVQVGAGGGYACGIREDAISGDRRVYCWGSNGSGRLGINVADSDVYPPTQEATGATNWQDLVAGRIHVCARKDDGSLHCWGNNNLARAGQDTGSSTLLQPTAVRIGTAGTNDWVSFGLGEDHVCAVHATGSLWCFGGMAHGQLGGGIDKYGVFAYLPSATRVGTASDWATVEGGTYWSCARKASKELWCWGENAWGQTGTGVMGNKWAPARVDAHGWLQIDGHSSQSCGVRTDGVLMCWGSGNDGVMGQGLGFPNYPSASVPVVASSDSDWTSVAVARHVACGIRQDAGGDRILSCWGDGAYGCNGNNSTGDEDTPVPVISGNIDWQQVDGGVEHFCAISAASGLYCWGRYLDGRLGIGAASGDARVPTQADAGPWYRVAAGEEFTCGLKADRSLWCWGDNTYGQLASGNSGAGTSTPTPSADTSTDWDILAAGKDHACAVKVDGSLWCWGNGNFAKLGLGDSTSQNRPTQVGGDYDWTAISTGVDHTCGMRDGWAYCWGSDFDATTDGLGALGDGHGRTINQATPAPVAAGPTTWASIVAADDFSMGLSDSGERWGWGSNVANQLGDGAGLVLGPTQVTGGE